MGLIPVKPIYRLPQGAAQAQNHLTETFPPPHKGIDLSTPLTAQDPYTAIVLDNFFVRRYGAETRPGYLRWTSNLGGLGTPSPVISIMSYFPPRGSTSAAAKLFAACEDGNIYDVTSQTGEATVPVASVNIPGQTFPGRFSWINFSIVSTSYLAICSPGGGYWTYDHAGGWVDRTASIAGGAASHAINFAFISSWKNRIWFAVDGLSEAYYLPTNAIQGAGTGFDFGQLFQHGGELQAFASWTLDAGDGVDDKFVVVSSSGDVLVYEGTDPSSAATFAIVGRWYVGRVPTGRRFMSKYGGDLAILCENGVEFMSHILQGRGLLDPEAGVSDNPAHRYNEVIGQDIKNTIGQMVWHMLNIASENAVIIVTPHNTKVTGLQYARGQVPNAWSTMSKMPMACAEVFNGELYFGTLEGTVCKAFSGNTDDALVDGTLGASITASLQSAFVAPQEDRISLKRPLLALVMLQSSAAPMLNVQVNTEWSTTPNAGSPAYNPSDVALWDVAHWDEAVWGGAANTYLLWVGLTGLGVYLSLRLALVAAPRTVFTGWRVVYEPGGIM